MDNSANNNPLVSIIVVTYNSAKYVMETLESAKSQVYKNIELIVTDDCSTDNTVEICKKWIEDNREYFIDSQIVTTERNSGIAANCNRGLKASKGEWLKYIAGDDVLLDNCILENLNFLKEHQNAKFITSGTNSIDENGNEFKCEVQNYKAFQKYYLTLPSELQVKTYARLPVFLNSPAFFMNRALIENVNGFDEEYKIYEDICIIFRVNNQNERIYHFARPTVKYRVHSNAISRSKSNSINQKRNKEQISIFRKYRKQHLSIFNLIDLSVYYETWLFYKYKGFMGIKLLSVLKKFSLFYWYLKIIKIRYKNLD